MNINDPPIFHECASYKRICFNRDFIAVSSPFVSKRQSLMVRDHVKYQNKDVE